MIAGFVRAITYAATYVSPTPTPTIKPKITQSSSTQIFNSAFYGAVVGAVATVLAELIVRIIGNYRSYRFLIGLIREVGQLRRLALLDLPLASKRATRLSHLRECPAIAYKYWNVLDLNQRRTWPL